MGPAACAGAGPRLPCLHCVLSWGQSWIWGLLSLSLKCHVTLDLRSQGTRAAARK